MEPDPQEPSDATSPQACPVCARSFDRAEHLKRHLATHSMERTCVCRVCGRKFSRKSAAPTQPQPCYAPSPSPCGFDPAPLSLYSLPTTPSRLDCAACVPACPLMASYPFQRRSRSPSKRPPAPCALAKVSRMHRMRRVSRQMHMQWWCAAVRAVREEGAGLHVSRGQCAAACGQ